MGPLLEASELECSPWLLPSGRVLLEEPVVAASSAVAPPELPESPAAAEAQVVPTAEAGTDGDAVVEADATNAALEGEPSEEAEAAQPQEAAMEATMEVDELVDDAPDVGKAKSVKGTERGKGRKGCNKSTERSREGWEDCRGKGRDSS